MSPRPLIAKSSSAHERMRPVRGYVPRPPPYTLRRAGGGKGDVREKLPASPSARSFREARPCAGARGDRFFSHSLAEWHNAGGDIETMPSTFLPATSDRHCVFGNGGGSCLPRPLLSQFLQAGKQFPLRALETMLQTILAASRRSSLERHYTPNASGCQSPPPTPALSCRFSLLATAPAVGLVYLYARLHASSRGFRRSLLPPKLSAPASHCTLTPLQLQDAPARGHDQQLTRTILVAVTGTSSLDKDQSAP
jgi:hypothetical protein